MIEVRLRDRWLSRLLHGRNAEEVPLTYRGWKWLLQTRFDRGWSGDLFDRIERTDWDLLIILDACRYDVLAAVADCAVVDRAISPVSGTPAFLRTAKARGVFEETVYISANPQTESHPPGTDIVHVPLSEECWDDRLSTVRPDDVYDRAIEYLEEGQRVVAHTVQPHYPHICRANDAIIPVQNGLHPTQFDVSAERFVIQDVLSRGIVGLDRAIRSYEIAAEFAWDRAKTVATTLSREGFLVAITADHGEAFGEWGLVEHPSNIGIKPLIEVPWLVFRPPSGDHRAETVEDRLTALGYA